MARQHRRLVTAMLGLMLYACAAGLILLIAGIVASRVWSPRSGEPGATEAATDIDIRAPEGGARAVPVTPEASVPIGQPAMLNDLRITVTKAGEPQDMEDLEPAPEDYRYWGVQFTVENTSNSTSAWVKPRVDSQIQYFVHGHYIWENSSECEYLVPKEGIIELEAGSQVECLMIYAVPRNVQPLYWVYKTPGYVDYVIFRVR